MSLVHFVALYRLRVRIPLGQMMAAVVAAMSVQWTVARAVGYGVWKESLPFMRTAKGGATRKGPDFPAFWEAVLARAAAGRRRHRGRHQRQADPRDQHLRGVLVVQSLPFIAAVAIAVIEGSRFNEFAYWRGVEARVAETLPRPRSGAQAAAMRWHQSLLVQDQPQSSHRQLCGVVGAFV